MSTYTYYFCDGVDRAMHTWSGENVLDMEDITLSDTICNVPEDWYLREGKNYSGVLADLDRETYNVINGREKGHAFLRTIDFSEIDEEEFDSVIPSKNDTYEWDNEYSDELNDFLSSLTDKQRTILQLKAEGLTLRAIARECGVCPQSIVTTLDRIKAKGEKHAIGHLRFNDTKNKRHG